MDLLNPPSIDASALDPSNLLEDVLGNISDDLSLDGAGTDERSRDGSMLGREEKSEREKSLSDSESGSSTPSTARGLGQCDWTEEEEQALRKKLDWGIIPLMSLLYLLCILDRSSIGNARISGMAKDLKLIGNRFNWTLTVFYIPYLLIDIPSNLLLKAIGPKFYIPFFVFLFGVTSIGCAVTQNFKSLIITRAFLGMFEGGALPGIAYVLSCFYRRRELVFRVGIFVSASALSGAFGGLFATVFTLIPQWGMFNLPIHTWRNIFFFEGLITLTIASGAYFFMPTQPSDTWFLTPRERHIAKHRMRGEFRERDDNISLKHIKAAVCNINNNICALGFFSANITIQSFQLFLPSILKSLGWESIHAQLFTIPPYLVAAAASIISSRLSDRHGRRGYYIVFHSLIAGLGYLILIVDQRPAIRYMAVFLSAFGAYPLGPFLVSWGMNNAPGKTFRAVSGAYITCLGTCGSFVATWTYLPNDEPRYVRGHSINFGAQVLGAIIGVVGIAYIRWENRQRSLGRRDHRLEGLDDTAKRELGYRPDFRYME